MATAIVPRVFKNYINGEWVESAGGHAFENRNPANTDELIGMFPESTAEDVDTAVDAGPRGLPVVAAGTRPETRRNSVSGRGNVVRRKGRLWRAT